MQLTYRSFEFDPKTIDLENRTVSVVFSTGAPVLRSRGSNKFLYEKIDMSQGCVDLSEFNRGAPVLIDHDNSSVKNIIGIIVPNSAKIIDGIGTASVRFGTDPDSDLIYRKVADGILKDVSIGYAIKKAKLLPSKNQDHDTVLITDCLLKELSFVVFPADPHAGVRSSTENTISYHIEGDNFTMTSLDNTNTFEAKPDPEKIEVRSASEIKPPYQTEQIQTTSDDIKKQEMQRFKEINDLVVRSNLDTNLSNQYFMDGLSVQDAKNKVLEKLAENSRKHPYITGGNPIEGIQHRNDCIATALLHREDPETYKLDNASARFKDMSIIDIARYTTNSDYFTSKHEIITRALATTDFPILTANVLNKKLRRDYQMVPKTYQPIVYETEVADFKPVLRAQLGDVGAFKEKPENSEYHRTSLTESGETYAIKEYGEMIEVTRKLIINDDMNALMRLPAKFARQAAELESSLVWGCLINNPNMSDGIPIFDLKHKNYAGKGSGGGPISVESIGAALVSMMTQTGLDKKTLISLYGKYLITPAALSTKAMQFLHTTSPTKDDDTNPFKGSLKLIVEPRLDRISQTAWYIASDIGLIDMIEVAYLQGQRGLIMESQPNFNTDGFSLKCRLDIGAKVLDYRGFYKNEGVSV